MTDKQTTNAVRQVLMNELGLTREVIREMMAEIIQVEAVKVANAMICQGHLERIVTNCFRDIVKGNGYGTTSLRDMVAAAAKTEATDFVKKHLRFVAMQEEAE
jgi:hypothetical protein